MSEQVQKPWFWGQFRPQARHSYRRRPGDMYPKKGWPMYAQGGQVFQNGCNLRHPRSKITTIALVCADSIEGTDTTA